MATSSAAPPLDVTVIADNPETLDSLHDYLSRVGVASNATRTLRSATLLPPAATSVVIFPDDFSVDEVVTSITALRATRPRLLIVLVTSAPQRFRAALDPDERSLPPMVLPRPAFGWIILDAIREHAHSELP